MHRSRRPSRIESASVASRLGWLTAVLAAGLFSGCTLDFDECLIAGRCAGEGGGDSAAQASCIDLPDDCGLDGQSCCAAATVPGGDFARGTDASDVGSQGGDDIVGWIGGSGSPASVSAFSLELFEVTVGRFRRFVDGYDAWRGSGHPSAGEGDHREGGGSGWSDAWILPASSAALTSELSCDVEATWTASPAAAETLPINCVSWQVAFAFCVWDAGRLATEAEWHRAASGGAEQRAFPWSSPAADTTISDSHAVIADQPLERVGQRSMGAARWGHLGIGGNLREWVLDSGADLSSYPSPCSDCVDLTSSSLRIRRGGDYEAGNVRARTSYRSDVPMASASKYHGIRCAR